MAKRTKDAIFLCTLDIGGYKVMNLQTGRWAMAWKVYKIPMPDEIIKKIKQMGIKDGINPRLTFGNWTLSTKIDNEIYEPIYKLSTIPEEHKEVEIPNQGIQKITMKAMKKKIFLSQKKETMNIS